MLRNLSNGASQDCLCGDAKNVAECRGGGQMILTLLIGGSKIAELQEGSGRFQHWPCV
jgi:hypothetical protein